MFSAICDQLPSLVHGSFDVANLRQVTAKYVKESKDDFLPFLTSKETGGIMTQGEVLVHYKVRECIDQESIISFQIFVCASSCFFYLSSLQSN